MYFKAYNFKKAQYEDININFVKNRMQYVDDVRRVVYSITDDGYSFINLRSRRKFKDNYT